MVDRLKKCLLLCLERKKSLFFLLLPPSHQIFIALSRSASLVLQSASASPDAPQLLKVLSLSLNWSRKTDFAPERKVLSNFSSLELPSQTILLSLFITHNPAPVDGLFHRFSLLFCLHFHCFNIFAELSASSLLIGLTTFFKIHSLWSWGSHADTSTERVEVKPQSCQIVIGKGSLLTFNYHTKFYIDITEIINLFICTTISLSISFMIIFLFLYPLNHLRQTVVPFFVISWCIHASSATELALSFESS